MGDERKVRVNYEECLQLNESEVIRVRRKNHITSLVNAVECIESKFDSNLRTT